jgi:HK97 family phage prohead protease
VRTKHAATKFVFSEDADTTGAFEAVFATLNVKDRDGDVIVPGAIEAGKEVLVMAQHRWNDLPIGKARIYEEGDELIARGKFFVDTPQGAASYATAKNVGDLQEWSFGFNVLDAEPGMVDEQRVTILKQLDVFEVSPVMIGAGVNTRTLAVKENATESKSPPEIADVSSADCVCDVCGCNQVSNTAPVAGVDESILRAVAQYEAIRAAMSGVQT